MKKYGNITHIIGLLLPGVFCMVFMASTARATQVLDSATVAPRQIDVSKGEAVQISWSQPSESTMVVFICDLDGTIVRNLHDKVKGQAGPQQVTWDGRDDSGNPCPKGAYVPIIKLRTKGMGGEIYNPMVSAWGAKVLPNDLTYDDQGKKISYSLGKDALCLLRVGERDGGPVYKTLFGWEPRRAGNHEETWDGLDASGIVQVAQKEKFELVLEAFTLPENAIFVEGSNITFSAPLQNRKRFPLRPPHGKKLSFHAMNTRNTQGDFSISASVGGSTKNQRNIPIIKNVIKINTLPAHPLTLKHSANEKAEVSAYMDGVFVTEVYLGNLSSSAIFSLDTKAFQNGEHVLTVNVVSSAGQIGTYSMKVEIQN